VFQSKGIGNCWIHPAPVGGVENCVYVGPQIYYSGTGFPRGGTLGDTGPTILPTTRYTYYGTIYDLKAQGNYLYQFTRSFSNIHMQKLDLDGNPQFLFLSAYDGLWISNNLYSGPFSVSDYDQEEDAFYVAYPFHDGNDYEISVIKVGTNGSLPWGFNGIQITNDDMDQYVDENSIVLNSAGYIIVTMEDYTNDDGSGDNSDSSVQVLTRDGDLLFEDQVFIAGDSDLWEYPFQIIEDGNKGASVAIYSDNNSTWDYNDFIFYSFTIGYQIENLSPNLKVENSREWDISEGSTYGSIEEEQGQGYDDTITILDSTDKPIATVGFDMSDDRDWSGVTGDIDTGEGKTFLHGITDVPGSAETFTMFIPKLEEYTGVFVCPDADSIEDIAEDCLDGYYKRSTDAELTVQELGGSDYWVLSGLSGTGVMNYNPPPEDEGDDDDDDDEEIIILPPYYPYCGNGIIEYGEECDNGNLNGKACVDFNSYTGGVLSCSTLCKFDYSKCEEEEDEEEEDFPVVEVPEEIEEIVEVIAPEDSLLSKLTDFIIENLENGNFTKVIVVGIPMIVLYISMSLLNYAPRDLFTVILSWLYGLFTRLGIRKKGKPYGYVYNSVTKEPLSLAIVRIYDITGSLVRTDVTDVYGVFTAELVKGKYKIVVNKSEFAFPSKVILGDKDGALDNIYHGELITKADRGELVVSIPVDPRNARKNALLRAIIVNRALILARIIQTAIFFIGLVISIRAYMINPSIINTIIIVLYAITLIVLLISTLDKKIKYGLVKDIRDSKLSGVELALKELKYLRTSTKRFTDPDGFYRFIVPPDEYELTITDPKYGMYKPKKVTQKKDDKKSSGPMIIAEDLIVIRK